MTYTKQLADPKWQRRRLEIFERDKFACTICGDKETELHVHHEYYERNKKAWEYPNSALKTLCAHCHLFIELRKKAFPNEEVVYCIGFKFAIANFITYTFVAKVDSQYYLISLDFDFVTQECSPTFTPFADKFLNQILDFIQKHKSKCQ